MADRPSGDTAFFRAIGGVCTCIPPPIRPHARAYFAMLNTVRGAAALIAATLMHRGKDH